MDSLEDHEPLLIGSALDPIRAAISMVADGSARRITVRTAAHREILPAARRLARLAGVRIELVRGRGGVPDIAVMPASPSAI